MSYKGIGEAKAITIAAAMELGRRKGVAEPLKRDTVQSSNDAFRIFYPVLCDISHEELWVALTNRASNVIEKVKISQGGVGETAIDLPFILKAAINTTCYGIILCHNHPSGNIQPSPQDDTLTARLREAAQLLNIKLLDHIIISDKRYYSYADEGRI